MNPLQKRVIELEIMNKDQADLLSKLSNDNLRANKVLQAVREYLDARQSYKIHPVTTLNKLIKEMNEYDRKDNT